MGYLAGQRLRLTHESPTERPAALTVGGALMLLDVHIRVEHKRVPRAFRFGVAL